MTLEQIQTMIKTPEYDFLRTNEHLKDRIILLTLGGSHAYGTNVEGSDVDVRGCALNSRSDILGLTNFEQVIDNATDTTVYSFRKLIPLLLNCNPNVIEMLGCKPEHYLILTDQGKLLLENRKLFLSQRAINSFGGYANQQLKRLENAIARDALTQAAREEHIRLSMENALMAFERTYTAFEHGSIKLFTGESDSEELERELFADVKMEGVPVRQFRSMLNDLSNILGTYDKLNHRNKKDENHLNKHAMHLLRLYLMALDIFEKEEIVTYREADHELLMSVRAGKFQNEDGTYQAEFFEMVNELEKRMQYAIKHTSLPKHPDMKKAQELVMAVNEAAIAPAENQ